MILSDTLVGPVVPLKIEYTASDSAEKAPDDKMSHSIDKLASLLAECALEHVDTSHHGRAPQRPLHCVVSAVGIRQRRASVRQRGYYNHHSIAQLTSS
jgi:hypothetical protein